MERKALSLLLLTGLVWGISFPVIKHALQFVPPLPLLFYRFALASLVMVPLAYVGWRAHGEHLSIRRVALLSSLGLSGTALSITLLYFGMNQALASRVVLLVSINPVTTRFLLSRFGFATQTKKQLIAMVSVALGTALVSLEPLWGSAVGSIKGNILAVTAGVVWAVYIVLSKFVFAKNTRENSPITLMALANLAATATLLPVLAFISPAVISQPIVSLHPQAIPHVLYLGLISTILGFVSYEAAYKLVKSPGASRAIYLQALVGVPLALWWLAEPLTPLFLLGAGIIAAGIYLNEQQ